ncbi:MAG: hypothetical protein JWO84_135 [Parcubacteria group bacterium]|nr:hypothetical protein [Parcubacteria group bacterium]
MTDDEPVRTERQAWKVIHGSGKQASAIRRWLHTDFEKMFSQGHRTSLRELAAEAAKLRHTGETFRKTPGHLVGKIHPAALDLLVEFGVDYYPRPWKKSKPQEWKLQPTNGGCAADAQLMLRIHNKGSSKPLMYIEGLAVGPDVPPMLHAWNTRGLLSRKAYDWNHYSSAQWSRYLGIAFRAEELEHLQRLIDPNPRTCPLLFANTHYPRIESEVHRILLARPGFVPFD